MGISFQSFSLFRGTRGRGQSLGAERRFLQHSANVRVNFHGFGDVCSVSAYLPVAGVTRAAPRPIKQIVRG
jgi:hypothetical protein